MQFKDKACRGYFDYFYYQVTRAPRLGGYAPTRASFKPVDMGGNQVNTTLGSGALPSLMLDIGLLKISLGGCFFYTLQGALIMRVTILFLTLWDKANL